MVSPTASLSALRPFASGKTNVGVADVVAIKVCRVVSFYAHRHHNALLRQSTLKSWLSQVNLLIGCLFVALAAVIWGLIPLEHPIIANDASDPQMIVLKNRLPIALLPDSRCTSALCTAASALRTFMLIVALALTDDARTYKTAAREEPAVHFFPTNNGNQYVATARS